MEIEQICSMLFEFHKFKIDLIVWKYMCNPASLCSSDKFKIDLIVWK